MFGVATLDDAAYVAGKAPEEFRRLSSSSNVFDQRKLIDAAFTVQAGERMITLARRRSSVEVSRRSSINSSQRRRRFSIMSTSSTRSSGNGSSSLRISANTQALLATIDGMENIDEHDDELILSNEPPQYPIPTELTSGCIERLHEKYVIDRGTAESSSDAIDMSFNGHGGYGGRAEPTVQWILSPIGPPENPVRITAIHSMFDPIAHCAESYGTVLNVRVGVGDENNNTGDEGETAAACFCFHPKALEKGKVMETGSDRYYYSLTMSGAPPTYLDREACGEKMVQRFVGYVFTYIYIVLVWHALFCILCLPSLVLLNLPYFFSIIYRLPFLWIGLCKIVYGMKNGKSTVQCGMLLFLVPIQNIKVEDTGKNY